MALSPYATDRSFACRLRWDGATHVPAEQFQALREQAALLNQAQSVTESYSSVRFCISKARAQ